MLAVTSPSSNALAIGALLRRAAELADDIAARLEDASKAINDEADQNQAIGTMMGTETAAENLAHILQTCLTLHRSKL